MSWKRGEVERWRAEGVLCICRCRLPPNSRWFGKMCANDCKSARVDGLKFKALDDLVVALICVSVSLPFEAVWGRFESLRVVTVVRIVSVI